MFVFELRKHAARFGALLLMTCAAVAAAQPLPRVTVVDLLRTLIAAGVDVLYSSELVPSDLDAPDSVPQGDPMARVVAALTANHLALQHTGGRGYVVVRAVASPTPPVAAGAAAAPVIGSAPRESTLDEVSVFASRYEFTTGTAGEPIGFDDRDIDQMPGAQMDSVRALRAAPGLATNLSAQPYVRGSLRGDVLVEFDGIALADPFHFRSFQSVMSIFNPSTVNRADVFTGGFPVKYGTRSGGVIDLSPRSVESGYEYGVGASLLSYELETVGRSESRPIEWLLVARVSSDSSVLQRLLSEFGEPQFSDVVGRIKWSIDPASSLKLGWLVLDDQVNLSSNSREEQASARSRDLNTWLRWDWTPTAAIQSHTSLAMGHSERNDSGNLYLPGLAIGSLLAERSFSEISLQSEWTYMPSAALSWNFGGEFTREKAELVFLRQEMLGDSIAAFFGRPPDATISSNQSPRSSTWGLFSSAHRRWQAFEAEVGVRVDGQTYHGFGVRSQMSPRINVRYDLSDRWHVYGSWGQFTQAQRVDEYRAEANQTTPDPAHRAVHLIAGVTLESPQSTTWRVEAYRHHWSSLGPYLDNALGPISILPQLEPDRVLVAPADADAAGIEISAQRSFSHGVSAWGTYTYSKVTDDVNGREVLRSWDQTHSANLGIAWTRRRTSVSAFLAWHSGWPQTPVAVVPATAAAPAYFTVGARNSGRWDSYFSSDLRLSTSLPLRSGELSLWIDATNLTNRSNYCCVDLNPINPTAGMPAMPDVNWPPRVINVGFSWRVRRPD